MVKFHTLFPQIKFQTAFLTMTMLLATIGVVMTLWLADKQDGYHLCIFNDKLRICACKAENTTMMLGKCKTYNYCHISPA